MSLTSGFFALKGDYTNKLSSVFSYFNLTSAGKDIKLNSWKDAERVIDEEYVNPGHSIQRRVVWLDNGWTIIDDLSLLLCIDDEALLKISIALSTPVFTLQSQGTSGAYGFSYFDRKKLREFFCIDGKIEVNYGAPLAEEKGLNINKDAFYDDVHGVAKKFGIDWEHAEKLSRFIVKQLASAKSTGTGAISENDMLAFADKSRPWWKFW